MAQAGGLLFEAGATTKQGVKPFWFFNATLRAPMIVGEDRQGSEARMHAPGNQSAHAREDV